MAPTRSGLTKFQDDIVKVTIEKVELDGYKTSSEKNYMEVNEKGDMDGYKIFETDYVEFYPYDDLS
jgi:hypothetical protein